MPTTALERIRAALAAAADDASPALTGHSPIALGWATVELDRAAAELAADLRLPPMAFAPGADSEILGARCRVADAALPGGLSLAILEPATEGRIAATLARLGEGPTVVWLRDDDAIGARGPRPRGPDRSGRSAWSSVVPSSGRIGFSS